METYRLLSGGSFGFLLLLFVLLCSFGCSPRSQVQSPLEGYYIATRNEIAPAYGVWHEDRREAYTITNWHSITSDTSPKTITTYLVAPKSSSAAPGQIWFNGSAIHENTPKVSVYPQETNTFGGETFIFPEQRLTNHWPCISSCRELIYVRSIEKATGGIAKGQDYYARCRVRVWTESTVYVEANAALLVSYLTNTATLLKP